MELRIEGMPGVGRFGNYVDISIRAMVVTWRCLDVSHTFYSDPSDR